MLELFEEKFTNGEIFRRQRKIVQNYKKEILVFWLKRLEWDKEKETWEKDHGFNKGQQVLRFSFRSNSIREIRFIYLFPL